MRINYLVNRMQQSTSWEANNHSASLQILRLLRNPKVHYRVHNSPSSIPNLSQMNPLQNFLPYFPKIRSTVIIPSTPMSSE